MTITKKQNKNAEKLKNPEHRENSTEHTYYMKFDYMFSSVFNCVVISLYQMQ